jgi:hypothetical protein
VLFIVLGAKVGVALVTILLMLWPAA